jgi:hypothetical protein
MTQTDFVDGLIIATTLAVSIWYLRTRYIDFKNAEEGVKTFIIVVLEVLLADANIFEGTVAARVGANHGAPWSNRIAMHLVLAGMSAATGLFLLNQVLEFIHAFVKIFLRNGYNKIFNWLNFIKQGLDIVVVIGITAFGPIFNWISIAYSNGDITIDTQLLMSTLFTFKGFFTFAYFDAFQISGTMHTTTFNAGGAILAHLFVLVGLASFFLDLGQFQETSSKTPSKSIPLPQIVNFFYTHGPRLGVSFANKQEVWDWINKGDKFTNQLILEEFFFEANGYKDILKDITKTRPERIAANKSYETVMQQALKTIKP